jgi:hypothetical protein
MIPAIKHQGKSLDIGSAKPGAYKRGLCGAVAAVTDVTCLDGDRGHSALAYASPVRSVI